MTTIDNGPRRLGATRRSVVRGAAWSVPVIAVATTAPAFAASNIPCPVVPPSSQWSATTGTGSLAAKNDTYAWDTNQDRWIIYKDASSAGSATFRTQSSPIPVVAGSTITAGYQLWWGLGNGNQASSFPGTFEVLVNDTVVDTVVTRSADAGAAGSYNAQSFTYKVPAGTTRVAITYRYTVPATTQSRNADDDIVATKPTFGTCTVN